MRAVVVAVLLFGGCVVESEERPTPLTIAAPKPVATPVDASADRDLLLDLLRAPGTQGSFCDADSDCLPFDGALAVSCRETVENFRWVSICCHQRIVNGPGYCY